jgi:N-acetyl-alpha-D-glucosaminyl L-malate synthase BshA
VTTLHGTDITIVGADPSYSEIVAFSIAESNAVTAVSASLRRATATELGVSRDIDVIPNFLDCAAYERVDAPELRRRYTGGDPQTRVLVHVSNFRPVKRIDAVIDVFARVAAVLPAVLLLVGDGPEISLARRQAQRFGVSPHVHFLGAVDNLVPVLSIADVFLLPSEQESFGLAAAEAMACGVPVVASNAGGLPEVIDNGVTGYLHPIGDVEAMAASAVALLSDADGHRRMASAAARRMRERFCTERVVPMYEDLYERVRRSFPGVHSEKSSARNT